MSTGSPRCITRASQRYMRRRRLPGPCADTRVWYSPEDTSDDVGKTFPSIFRTREPAYGLYGMRMLLEGWVVGKRMDGGDDVVSKKPLTRQSEATSSVRDHDPDEHGAPKRSDSDHLAPALVHSSSTRDRAATPYLYVHCINQVVFSRP